jgi:WD40 repeat protein
LWDATTGKLLLTMEGHFGIVAGISWRPPGSGPPRLLTAGYDGTARIWDPTTGAELLTLQLSQAYVQGAVWSPDGERILAVAGWESARIFGTTPINRAFTPREPAPPPRPVK